ITFASYVDYCLPALMIIILKNYNGSLNDNELKKLVIELKKYDLEDGQNYLPTNDKEIKKLNLNIINNDHTKYLINIIDPINIDSLDYLYNAHKTFTNEIITKQYKFLKNI